jgi:CxxC-x17-CxxC domain-containing protein
MGNFKKGSKGSFGGGSRGGSRGGDRGDRGGRGDFKKKTWGNDRGEDRGRSPLKMYRAVCADCGRNCEVPFMPNGKKPVLCTDCFGGNGDRGGRSDFKDRAPRREFNDSQSSVTNLDELKKQLHELNFKVDKLLNLFEKKSQTKDKGLSSQEEPTIIVKKPKSKKVVTTDEE